MNRLILTYRLWRDPVLRFIMRARIAEEQRDELLTALKRSMIAIDDWLNTYASDQCDEQRVAEARARIREMGTIAYIADVQQQNRNAIAKVQP